MYRTIKATKPKHFEIIKDLDKKIMPDDYRVNIEGGDWWITYYKGEPVAFAGVAIVVDVGYGFLRRAGVLEAHRGKGLQKRLIKVRLNHLKKRKIAIALTYTVLDNPASANSLISLGFKLYVPSELYVGPNVLYFKKTKIVK